MPLFTDQTGRQCQLSGKPKRIVSLVPSISEVLFDLGLEADIVGITKFCVHPTSLLQNKKNIGGTKQLRLEVISDLQPDLILANKEENNQAQVMALAEHHVVYVSDIGNQSQSVEFINAIGQLTNTEIQVRHICALLQSEIENLQKQTARFRGKNVLYLIWQKPWMAAGIDTYISDTLKVFGLENVLIKWETKGLRYPKLSIAEMKQLDPDFIILSSEPYPFKTSHAQELHHELEIPTLCADGELFSWYGSRLLNAQASRNTFINRLTEIFP